MKKPRIGCVLYLLMIVHVVTAQVRTIAVVPFQNLSGNEQLSWFGDGLAESISIDLSQYKSLTVVERVQIKNILDEYKLSMIGMTSDNELISVGEMLSAQFIIMGTYQVYSDQIRVTAKIINISTSKIIRSTKVTTTPNNIFLLQDQILYDLLSNKSKPAPLTNRTKETPNDFNAFVNFGKGLEALDRKDTRTAEKLMKNAVNLQPSFKGARIYLEQLQSRSVVVSNPFQYTEDIPDVFPSALVKYKKILVRGSLYYLSQAMKITSASFGGGDYSDTESRSNFFVSVPLRSMAFSIAGKNKAVMISVGVSLGMNVAIGGGVVFGESFTSYQPSLSIDFTDRIGVNIMFGSDNNWEDKVVTLPIRVTEYLTVIPLFQELSSDCMVYGGNFLFSPVSNIHLAVALGYTQLGDVASLSYGGGIEYRIKFGSIRYEYSKYEQVFSFMSYVVRGHGLSLMLVI